VRLHLCDEETGLDTVVSRHHGEGLSVLPEVGGDGATAEAEGGGNAPQKLKSALCDEEQAPENPLGRLCETAIVRDERITELSVEAGERPRYKFVRQALGTDVFADAVERAKDVRDALQEKVDALEKERDEHGDTVSRLKGEIAEVREGAADAERIEESAAMIEQALVEAGAIEEGTEVDRTALVEASRKRVIDLQEEAEQLARALSKYNEQREEIERYRRGGEGAQRIERIGEELRETRERIEQAESEKATAQERLEAFRDEQPDATKLAELRGLGADVGLRDDACPLCQAPHTPEEFEQRLRELRASVEEIIDDIDERKAQLDQRSQELSTLAEREEALTDERDRLQEERGELLEKLEGLRQQVVGIIGAGVVSGEETDDVAAETAQEEDEQSNDAAALPALPAIDVDTLKAEIEERRTQRTALDQATSDVEASLAYEKIDALESKQKDAQKQLGETEKRLQHARKMKGEANEVRKRIEEEEGQVHQDRIAQLQPLFEELYARLRPHVDWQDIETKIRGNIQHYLRFDVEGKNPSFFFSSGQRRAVGLAFLLSVHLGCTWNKLSTLMLDDPIQHIDDFRALQLTEVLASMRKSGRQLIVTVEDEALARLLRRRLRSSTEEAGAHVQMAYDARTGTRIEEEIPVAPMPERVLEYA